MNKEEILNEMKNCDPEMKIQNFNNIHPKLLERIFVARQVFKNSTNEEFELWLNNQNFYEGGLALSTISYILRLTRERVRQIETMGLARLKHPKYINKIRQYKSISQNQEQSLC